VPPPRFTLNDQGLRTLTGFIMALALGGGGVSVPNPAMQGNQLPLAKICACQGWVLLY